MARREFNVVQRFMLFAMTISARARERPHAHIAAAFSVWLIDFISFSFSLRTLTRKGIRHSGTILTLLFAIKIEPNWNWIEFIHWPYYYRAANCPAAQNVILDSDTFGQRPLSAGLTKMFKTNYLKYHNF